MFFWRNYGDNFLATAMSLMGTIGVTIGAIMLGIWLGDFITWFAIAPAVIAFVAGKFILNKITDAVDEGVDRAISGMGNAINNRKINKLKAAGNDQNKLVKQLKRVYKMPNNPQQQNALYSGIKQLTDPKYINDMIVFVVQQNRIFLTGETTYGPDSIKTFKALFAQLPDDAAREQIRKFYRIP